MKPSRWCGESLQRWWRALLPAAVWYTLVYQPSNANAMPITCSKLPDVHWNATNSIFRIDNTDHIIDVNKGNNPFEYDQVNIICPVYSPGTKEEDMERYIIYNVSKEEYDSCRITNPNPRIIAVCDKPHQVMYFTITFRSFTPQPGGLEFRPGQDYYFISTSNGGLNGLHQRIGGRCATHNMKVIFKVCCDPSKSVHVSNMVPSTTSSSSTSGPLLENSTPANLPAASKQPISKFAHTTSTVAPAVTNPQDKGYNVFGLLPPLPPSNSNNNNQRSPSNNNNNNNGVGRQRSGSSTTPVPPYWKRPYVPTLRTPYKTFEVPSEEKKSNKKTEDRDKLPNETRAKNEELVKNSSANGSLQAVCVWVTTCAVMAATLVSALGR